MADDARIATAVVDTTQPGDQALSGIRVQAPAPGDIVIPGWPVHMSDIKVSRTAAPLLGAETDSILGGLLDMKPADIKILRDDKVVQEET